MESSMQNLKVINLFGSPGAGKSTTAAGLFNLMKLKGFNVELITEVAKDLTWEKNWMGLAHQPSILAQQDYRLFRLRGQVDWVITDSPLPIQIAYQGEEWLQAGLDKFTWDLFSRYENYNVLIHRNTQRHYQEAGRNQTLEEAMVLDNVIDNLFHTAILDDELDQDLHLEVTAREVACYEIYEWLHGPFTAPRIAS